MMSLTSSPPLPVRPQPAGRAPRRPYAVAATFLLVLSAVVANEGCAQDARRAVPPAPAWDDVRAVLESRCLRCHGGERVRSGFALANAETFARGGARGSVLEPDDLSSSRLLEVLEYGNPDLAMPQDGKLPDDELALLRDWILAGAPWPADDAGGRLADPEAIPEEEDDVPAPQDARDWWAYAPLRDEAPGTATTSGSRHPVDVLLDADRADRGQPRLAPDADPATMLRRATYDLTGLPPTEAERARFLAAVESAGFETAWSDLLDRLLASPHYGEHMARHWMDLVRYAETNGYERDSRKPNIWRYRDYLIRSFGSDKPYDRFVMEQLAGDEFDAYAPQLVEDAADPARLLATGYYRLMVWDDEPADRAQAYADQIADIVDVTGQTFLSASIGCARCHDHKADPISQRDYYAFTAFFNNIEGYHNGLTDQIADAPRDGQITVEQRDADVAAVDAELAPWIERLAAAAASHDAGLEPRVLVATDAPWRVQADGRPPEGWFQPGFDDDAWDRAAGAFGHTDHEEHGTKPASEWRTHRLLARTRFALERVPGSSLPPLVLEIRHSGPVAVHLNGTRLDLPPRDESRGARRIQLGPDALGALVTGSNVLAVEARKGRGRHLLDVSLHAGAWLDDPRSGRVRLALEADRWLDQEGASRARALLQARADAATAAVAEPYTAMIVRERGHEAPTQRVLQRGSVHAPGDAVAPGVPEVFLRAESTGPELPEPIPGARTSGRRLALARWLVGEARHLTARTMANRVWQMHFGRGLCPTPGDFGRLGQRPTQPDLLDHLARFLIDNGWSLKALHRHLLTSDAFRMDSRITSEEAAEALRRDPGNRAWWRFEPRRLRAEEFRDSVLMVSGQLVTKRFGPFVFPPLAAEVLQTASRPDAAWGRSSPEDQVRRSIYVHVKRSLRVPLLEALDMPDPDLPCAERFPTNVPTQTLMTLNGAFVADAAEALAARLRARDEVGGDDRAFAAAAVEAILRRPASTAEADRHAGFLARLRDEHGMGAEAAQKTLCLALFNLNEFLWID